MKKVKKIPYDESSFASSSRGAQRRGDPVASQPRKESGLPRPFGARNDGFVFSGAALSAFHGMAAQPSIPETIK
jgi:hypothetical protein